ncbi:MAG: hypothetical protein LBI64_03935 [Coriobacteriales bacterium]|nr:hypothetical protein [Coriobacteriales bacterium]
MSHSTSSYFIVGDSRQGQELSSKTPPLNLDGTEVQIGGLIGVGTSCLAYDGKTVGLSERVVVKEWFPRDLAACKALKRDTSSSCLIADAEVMKDIEGDELRKGFEKSFIKWLEYQREAPRFTLWPELHPLGDTVYLLTKLGGEGMSLSQSRADLLKKDCSRESLCSVLEVTISLLNRLQPLHTAGLLYIDVKPENILLFSTDKTPGESRAVALFDFDSTASLTDIQNGSVILRPTAGWAPHEAWEPTQPESVNFCTDLYGVGRVLLWLLGVEPSADGADCLGENFIRTNIGAYLGRFASTEFSTSACNTIIVALAKVLANALRHDTKKRYQSIAEMRAALIAVREGLGTYHAEPEPNDDELHEFKRRFDNMEELIRTAFDNVSRQLQKSTTEIIQEVQKTPEQAYQGAYQGAIDAGKATSGHGDLDTQAPDKKSSLRVEASGNGLAIQIEVTDSGNDSTPGKPEENTDPPKADLPTALPERPYPALDEKTNERISSLINSLGQHSDDSDPAASLTIELLDQRVANDESTTALQEWVAIYL